MVRNVIHLNTSLSGGAASGAYRLHDAMKKNGLNSHMIILKGRSTSEVSAIQSDDLKEIISEREKIIFEKYRNYETEAGKYFFYPGLFFLDYSKEIKEAFPFKPDIIIAHWTTEFANPLTLYRLYKSYRVPILWYMTDMEPMTGGCHYSFDCKKYRKGCRRCPALRSIGGIIPVLTCIRNRMFLKLSHTEIIASSGDMYRKALSSSIHKKLPVHVIHRGIDSEIFKLDNKKSRREKWGIEKNDIVLFFGAQSISEKRKGMGLLLKALKILSEKMKNGKEVNTIVLLYAGRNPIKAEWLSFRTVYAGFRSSQEELAEMYQVADMYICPTIQDSGPMMVSESLMCGTPVVGFKVGILPDVIKNGDTGFLAEKKSGSELEKVIEKMISISIKERESMSVKCREYALLELSYQKQVESILKIVD